MKVIIIGGGWAGCAAAITARYAGAEVEVYEKTDMLLGLGNVGGIMRNNGRYTAAEELCALGLEDIFNITDSNTLHKNLNFPGHEHAWLYDVIKIEPEMKRYMKKLGIKINLIARVVDVKMKEKSIEGIYLSDGTFITGDAFVETTGSTGPMGNCLKYGKGCVMCILRCPSFGPRVSISNKAGVEDLQGEREDGTPGAFSGSVEVSRESLSEELNEILTRDGVAIIKIPEKDMDKGKLKLKVCQQYALPEFAENVILLDTGHIKIMTPYYPLEKLRELKGFENARYIDPYSGGKGNSIRYLSVAPRDNGMKVKGIDNLFCAGEKSGLFVGHTEAIATGSLAGHNSVRIGAGKAPIILPEETAVGDLIKYTLEKMETLEGRRNRYTFAGSDYFIRMKERGLYTTNLGEIRERINKLHLTNLYKIKII
ncbi:MAG TPA: FAD-dependent oxidoreductase [Clostridiaceae bacterium]